MAQNFANIYSVAKGIGIVLMVIGHATFAINGYAKYINDFIYTFHMPLFFVISGMCFKDVYFSKPKQYIIKRWKRLYIPYVCYCLLFLLLHNFFLKIGIYNSFHGFNGSTFFEYSFHDILAIAKNIVLYMNGEEKPLVGLWFLKDMFVASCLFVLLGRLWNGNFIIYGVLILFISFCLLHFNPIGRINTGRVCLGLFYICLGFNLKKIENCIFDIKLWQTICLLIVTIIFSFRFYNKGEMINLTAFQMPIFVLGSFSGIILLLKVSNILLKNNKATTLLSLFGNNSMTILVWHALSFKVANAVLIVIYNFDWTYMSYYFTIPIKEVENYYWILYSICGLIVPISILIIFEKIKIKIF